MTKLMIWVGFSIYAKRSWVRRILNYWTKSETTIREILEPRIFYGPKVSEMGGSWIRALGQTGSRPYRFGDNQVTIDRIGHKDRVEYIVRVVGGDIFKADPGGHERGFKEGCDQLRVKSITVGVNLIGGKEPGLGDPRAKIYLRYEEYSDELPSAEISRYWGGKAGDLRLTLQNCQSVDEDTIWEMSATGDEFSFGDLIFSAHRKNLPTESGNFAKALIILTAKNGTFRFKNAGEKQSESPNVLIECVHIPSTSKKIPAADVESLRFHRVRGLSEIETKGFIEKIETSVPDPVEVEDLDYEESTERKSPNGNLIAIPFSSNYIDDGGGDNCESPGEIQVHIPGPFTPLLEIEERPNLSIEQAALDKLDSTLFLTRHGSDEGNSSGDDGEKLVLQTDEDDLFPDTGFENNSGGTDDSSEEQQPSDDNQ